MIPDPEGLASSNLYIFSANTHGHGVLFVKGTFYQILVLSMDYFHKLQYTISFEYDQLKKLSKGTIGIIIILYPAGSLCNSFLMPIYWLVD